MTTYSHMIKVSRTPGLSISEKLHELFCNALSLTLNEAFDEEDKSRIPEELVTGRAALVMTEGWGQIMTFRLQDNTYVAVDTGMYTPDGDKFAVHFLDELDEDWEAEYWLGLLDDQDVPLTFYHGGFIDGDLEESFLASFPGN